MPNKIKITNSNKEGLTKGNVSIDVGNGIGPTISHGFFNGINPPVNGYTFYIKKTGIVEDGIVFAIDASNYSSYRSDLNTDIVWDLSDNNNHAQLINDVGFDSNNGGSFSFNGTNNYIDTDFGNGYDVGNNSMTICSWVNYNNNNSEMYMSFGATSGNRRAYFGVNSSEWRMGIESNAWTVSVTGGSNPSAINGWHFITIVFDSTVNNCIFYLNTVEEFYKSYNDYSFYKNLSIGAWDEGTGYYWNSKISSVIIYNRVLSNSEIQQNYNTTKSKFGL